MLGSICMDLREEEKEATEVWPGSAGLNYFSHLMQVPVVCAREVAQWIWSNSVGAFSQISFSNPSQVGAASSGSRFCHSLFSELICSF